MPWCVLNLSRERVLVGEHDLHAHTVGAGGSQSKCLQCSYHWLWEESPMANCLGTFYSNRRYESAAATWPEFSLCLYAFKVLQFQVIFLLSKLLLERAGAGSFQHAVGSIALGFLPRNVITYSTLISACEKGEQWQRALCLDKTS